MTADIYYSEIFHKDSSDFMYVATRGQDLTEIHPLSNAYPLKGY